MKITIDTSNKTIKVEETVNFCELNKELESLLGENLKDYNVLPMETVNIPYVHPYPFIQPQPLAPYYAPQKFWWDNPTTCESMITVIGVDGQLFTYPKAAT